MADLEDLWIRATEALRRCTELMPSRRLELHAMLDALWVRHLGRRFVTMSDAILRAYEDVDPDARYERVFDDISNRAQQHGPLMPDVPLSVVGRQLVREERVPLGAEWIFCQASRAYDVRTELAVAMPSPLALDRLRDIDLELEAFAVYSVLSSSLERDSFGLHMAGDRMQNFVTRARSIFNRSDGGYLAMLPRNKAELDIAAQLVALGSSELVELQATINRCVAEFEHWTSSCDRSTGGPQQPSPCASESMRAAIAEVGGLGLERFDEWTTEHHVAIFERLVESAPNRLTCGGIIEPPSRDELGGDEEKTKTVADCVAKLLAHSPLARPWMRQRTDVWREWLPPEPAAAAPSVTRDVGAPPAESAWTSAQDEVFGTGDLLARIVRSAVPFDATRPHSSVREHLRAMKLIASGLDSDASRDLAKRVALGLVPASARGAVQNMSDEQAGAFLERAEAIGSLWGLATAICVAEAMDCGGDMREALEAAGLRACSALQPGADREELDVGYPSGVDGVATAIVALPRALAIAEQSWGRAKGMSRFDLALLVLGDADDEDFWRWSRWWRELLAEQMPKLIAAFPWTIPAFAATFGDFNGDTPLSLFDASQGTSLSIRAEIANRMLTFDHYTDAPDDVATVQRLRIERVARIVGSRAFDPRLALDVLRQDGRIEQH